MQTEEKQEPQPCVRNEQATIRDISLYWKTCYFPNALLERTYIKPWAIKPHTIRRVGNTGSTVLNGIEGI